MIKQIKIKAWDKSNKIMYQWEEIGAGLWKQIVDGKLQTDIIPLLYSEKKDLKNKEIYEGDIIEFEEPMFESEMIKGYVILEDAAFVAKCRKEEFELRDIKEPEILGNIFENPKLLKK